MELSERPTPVTDAAILASNGQWSFVLCATCKQLERERDEAREQLRLANIDCFAALTELDAAQEKIAEIKEAAK
jgi:hypothetical protein